jgi:hypothetical protein
MYIECVKTSNECRYRFDYKGCTEKNCPFGNYKELVTDVEGFLEKCKIINSRVWNSLCQAYIYGSATPMNKLRNLLEIIHKRVMSGEIITLNAQYMGKQYIEHINVFNFDEIILKFFDDFVLSGVKKGKYF